MKACASFDRRGNCVETLVDHVELLLNLWDNCVSKYYKNALVRVLGGGSVDLILDTILLLHDSGKAMRVYSNPEVRHQYRTYRHEVLSSYFTFEALKRANVGGELLYIASSAVLLHHEPIILSSYAGWLGERYITASAVEAMLRKIPEEQLKAVEDVNYFKLVDDRLRKRNIKLDTKQIMSNVNVDDVVKVFKEVLSFVSRGDVSARLKRRAQTAALLHVLVSTDTLGAEIGREGEGTWLSRRARGVEGPCAEPGGLVDCIHKTARQLVSKQSG